MVFYGRFQIRLLSDTLRRFAAGGIVGHHEPQFVPVDGEVVPNTPRPSIEDLPELNQVFQAVFVAPDAFVSMNTLDQNGRDRWHDIVWAYETGRFAKARELAGDFAQWLDDIYQHSERIQFDDASFSILLYGEPYAWLRPEGYALVKLLAVYKNDGNYVNADEIICAFNDLSGNPSSGLACVRRFPTGSAGLKRLARAVSYLPPPLQRLIQSLPGRGRRLCLDPI